MYYYVVDRGDYKAYIATNEKNENEREITQLEYREAIAAINGSEIEYD